MSRERELAKNTIILGIGSFFPKLMSMITLPIITASLTKAEYGTYDLISTLIMLLIPLATLQIQSAAFRFLIDCRDDAKKTRGIITNIVLVTACSACVVALGIGLFMPNLSRATRVIVAICFFAETLNTSVSMIVRGLSQNKLYSLSAILCAVVNCIGIVILICWADQGLFGVIAAMTAANFVSVLVGVIGTRMYVYVRWEEKSGQLLKEMLAFSWPMIPNNLSNWVLKVSDRLVITAFLGVEANAVYAVANKIPNLLSIAQSVFTMAWQENASMAVHDADAQSYYSRMFDRIFSFLVGCTALLIGLTPLMFALLIKGDYSDAYIQMPILILGMFFYCMAAFQGGIYIAHKRTKSVGVTTVCAAAINLGIDLAFVNPWGITAGSVSTLVAYVVLYAYRLIDSLKFQPIQYRLGKQAALVGVLIVQLVLCAQRSVLLDIINGGIGCAIFLWLNWTLIGGVTNSMKLFKHHDRQKDGQWEKYVNLDQGCCDTRELPDLVRDKSNCCGCTACYAICPSRAICMQEDEESFFYPVIDAKQCIRCYRCVDVCAFKKDQKSKGYA